MSAALVSAWLFREVTGVVVLGAGACAAVTLAKIGSARRRVRSPRQANLSERSFTEYLRRVGFDPIVASTTYRYLREIQDVRFPILPGDTLDWDLGLDADQVSQTITALMARLDRQPARAVQLPVTVEDLVRTVQTTPRMGEAAAA